MCLFFGKLQMLHGQGQQIQSKSPLWAFENVCEMRLPGDKQKVRFLERGQKSQMHADLNKRNIVNITSETEKQRKTRIIKINCYG